MVARRVLGPSRTLTDRLRQRAAPTRGAGTRGAGNRGAGALASRAQGILGGQRGADFSAVGRGFDDMMNHRAVAFGREMTASPAQGQIDDITGDVRGRLAEAGIYKDDLGTFQIAGMERSDPSRAIRDAAIAAMDPTGEVARRVAFSESQLNPEGGWARPTPINRSNTAELAIPGISDVMSSRMNEIGKPPADITTRTSTPATIPGTAPQNLPPGTLPRQPRGGTIPQDTTGTAKPPAPAGTLPRQGPEPAKPAQPPNAVIPGSVGTLPGYPNPGTQTTPAATLGLPAAGTASGLNQAAPTTTFPGAAKPADFRPAVPVGTGATPAAAPSPGLTTTPAAQGFTGNGYAHPESGLMQGMARTPGPGERGIDPSTGEPIYGPGTIPAQPRPSDQAKPPAPNPAPGGLPPGTLPRQGGSPGTQTTPAAPGTPGQTPSTPGTTTASRPGGGWPTQKLGPFGTDDGGTSMFPPGFPFQNTGRPGAAGTAAGLEGLGASIQQRVQEAIGGNPVRQPLSAGVTPIPGLEGLGDRIRAVVTQGQQDMNSRLAGLGMNLPNTGTTPGGLPGGGMNTTAPGTQPPGRTITPAAPAPNTPTGGGGTLGSYGNASVDQWDSAFIAAGQKYGVDPTILKAMMEIESGGNGNMSMDQCRDDGYGDGLSCGPMQIKGDIWGHTSTVEDQIMLAAKILGDYKAANPGATDKDALFAVYFPGNDPNGTTQGSYAQRVDQLQAQMGPYDPNVTTLPTTGTGTSQAAPAPEGSVIYPPGSAPGTSVTGDPRGAQIADLADNYVGVPYPESGGWGDYANPDRGWDCSGFTYWVAKQLGYTDFPAGSHFQYQWAQQNGRLKTDPSQAQVGDIIFFDTGIPGTVDNGGNLNNASHVGIYLGNGKFIHSSQPGVGTIISDLDQYLAMYPYLGSVSLY